MQQDQMQEIRQTVPVNVYRTPDRVVVAAPMPGVLPEDLTINVTAAGRLVLQSGIRGVLRAEFFDVEPTEEKHSAAPVARTGGDQAASDDLYSGFQPLTADDIAETLLWIASLPEHVNIDRLELMPVSQSWAGFQVFRNNAA